jgi:small-conductance mechanosensitive channel
MHGSHQSRAEVIVPNSELISSKVINWTLSDQRRRVDLPIGVAYGTEPEKVMTLLLDVAAEEKRVLPEPKPVACLWDLVTVP